MLVLLTGGTGGAKLVQGLGLETGPEKLFIICNTADDFVVHGLHVSPDLDTITYTLAGIVDTAKGWGIGGDTFVVLERLGRLGGETWFQLGDRDLATHITRSRLLSEGMSLSQITERICKALGIKSAILPMSDERVETKVVTPKQELSFQEYFVRERWADDVLAVSFAGAERSRPAPRVLESIQEASAVILCPSNPVTSIGPILAIPGIRDTLRQTKARIFAVSPIIRGMPLSGPAHKFMAAKGMEVSAFGVARAYGDFLDLILVAPEDSGLEGKIKGLGIKPVVSSIRMDSVTDRRRLARELLALI
ncbi:MAG: 2-phospho-L-lactate transferase [Candidatus Binatia bacterium]